MNENIFRLILLAIPLAGCVITIYVIPIFKEKLTEVQMANIEYWVKRAVLAAEALFLEAGSGADKREYVIQFINNKFNKDHIVITEEQIRILLEAVWEEYIKMKS